MSNHEEVEHVIASVDPAATIVGLIPHAAPIGASLKLATQVIKLRDLRAGKRGVRIRFHTFGFGFAHPLARMMGSPIAILPPDDSPKA